MKSVIKAIIIASALIGASAQAYNHHDCMNAGIIASKVNEQGKSGTPLSEMIAAQESNLTDKSNTEAREYLESVVMDAFMLKDIYTPDEARAQAFMKCKAGI